MSPLVRVFIAVGLVVLARPVLAGDRLADIAFARIDTNGDGRLDASELREARAQRFVRLDIDGDGFITAAEQTEASHGMLRKAEATESAMAIRFKTLDTDGDGKLTRDEFMNAPGGMASRLDKDGDGAVSKS